ncbi:MAG TPA: glycosyltransferase [Patescibacteria group bacterium]|nr:glycosyltransferase [Patescibacteria group bacterium]
MEINKKIKVALVHDFLTAYGGAERVLEVLTEMFPDAPIYTLLYDREKMRGKFENKIISASFLQKFPEILRKRYKFLLPLMPIAPETFDLRDYDLVISSTGAWSKGIVTRLNTIHISYFHSPMRFAWDANGEYLSQQKKGFITNFIVRRILNYIRIWDKVAADRPDYIISNSKYTAVRVKKYYGRDSEVIYPPATINEGSTSIMEVASPKKYFLIVSRLSPYKKIDAVVEAFNKLELPLVIVGEGEQKKYIERIAEKNIQILGWKNDQDTEKIFKNARAFIFPCIDDFGIAPVEAMSCGVPVIAIREGGVLETVIEGKTGEFFDAATPEVIADGVRRFMENEKGYDKNYIIKRAQEFRKERFIDEIKKYIENIILKNKND